KRARLKYLIDKWGIEKFLAETQKNLAFPLVKLPIEKCTRRPPSIKHGHIGVYRQKQKGKNYIGVAIPVGVMTTRQMRRLADLAQNYGSASLRLTPWQNLLLPDIPDGFVETVKRQLVWMGFHHESTNILGGLVACTGNTGCKWAATDTKGQAVALGAHLNKTVQLDSPVNIHLTGCPNSCAQHYIGDIGLVGAKVQVSEEGDTVEGYHIHVGGGFGPDATLGRELYRDVKAEDAPKTVERVLKAYFAGLLSLDGGVTPLSSEQTAALMAEVMGAPAARGPLDDGDDGQTPWHDQGLPLGERMKLAENRPLRRRMMAAMGQQDCG